MKEIREFLKKYSNEEFNEFESGGYNYLVFHHANSNVLKKCF